MAKLPNGMNEPETNEQLLYRGMKVLWKIVSWNTDFIRSEDKDEMDLVLGRLGKEFGDPTAPVLPSADRL